MTSSPKSDVRPNLSTRFDQFHGCDPLGLAILTHGELLWFQLSQRTLSATDHYRHQHNVSRGTE